MDALWDAGPSPTINWTGDSPFLPAPSPPTQKGRSPPDILPAFHCPGTVWMMLRTRWEYHE